MQSTHTTTHNPYHLIEMPGTPEPQGIPIPPRSTHTETEQSEAAQPEAAEPDVSLVDLRAGMACRTPQGHAVRIMQILHADVAEVHLLRDPHIEGELTFNDLTPIPVKVQEEDQVILHVGNLGFPIHARVIEVSGDYALFFSSKWGEALWGHTAHVMHIRTRDMRRTGAGAK